MLKFLNQKLQTQIFNAHLVNFSAIDTRKWDTWEMTLNLLNNSHKFQSPDLAEKAVLLLFENLSWDLKYVLANQDFSEVGICQTNNFYTFNHSSGSHQEAGKTAGSVREVRPGHIARCGCGSGKCGSFFQRMM